MGGDTSKPHNLQNLAEAIRSIPTGPLPPGVPTSLAELKEMVNKGREIVVGTEIPDDYAGQSNPLIVAQNLNSSNNEAYGGAEGVILVRKYVEPTSQVFGSSVEYSTSTIKNFLDTTYLNNCSDTLKSIIADISVQYYNGSSKTMVAGKWFLMSAYEVCNRGNLGTNGYEGVMWDLWKQRTGLSSPDAMNLYNSGRIMRDRNGTARYVWLRSRYSSSNVCCVNLNGDVGSDPSNDSIGVLPACFIGKDTVAQPTTLELRTPFVITSSAAPVVRVKSQVKTLERRQNA